MKAILLTRYGQPQHILHPVEVEKPVPNDDQFLVRILAASLTYSNLMMAKGSPFFVRIIAGGLFKPKPVILGSDIAGRVEAAGKNMVKFQPGDEVFGYLADVGKGGYAEYVCAPEKALGLKPDNLSFEEAAAVPEAALVALQAVRDDGQVQPGQKVLVYGASGGIGTFAVQIAKAYGAEVTGVCSTRNLELVRSLGAERVVDYTKEDFTKVGHKYDLIIATAGYRSISDYKRALKTGGIYVCTGGSWSQLFQALLLGKVISKNGPAKMGALTMDPNYDFVTLRELIEAGKVKPVIDRRYPLSEIGKAFDYYGKRHARGKVIITI